MGKSHSKTKKSARFPKIVSKKEDRVASGQASAHTGSQFKSSTVSTCGAQNDATLRVACELVLRVGSLVHQVQLERGITAIFAGSAANDSRTTLDLLRLQTDKSLEELEKFTTSDQVCMNMQMRTCFEDLGLELRQDRESPNPTCSNASRLEEICKGALPSSCDNIESKPHLRHRLNQLRNDVFNLTYLQATERYTDVLTNIVQMMHSTMADPRLRAAADAVSAYVAFLHVKETLGRERALVGGMLAAGGRESCLPRAYASLVRNGGEHAAHEQVFMNHAPAAVLQQYRATCAESTAQEEVEIFSGLKTYKEAGLCLPLNQAMPELTAQRWFEFITKRIDRFLEVERLLAARVLHAGIHPDLGMKLSPSGVLVSSAPCSSPEDELELGLGPHFVIDVRELEIYQEIGRGTTGSTYLARWRGTQCAVKVVHAPRQGAERDMLLTDFAREVRVLKRAHHPSICMFMGCALDPPTYCVVLEFMAGGSLYAALRRPGANIDFFQCATQVAQGMEYLHDHCNLLHRDLKSPNLLLDGHGKTKIADFGLTCLNGEGLKTAEIGTYRWMAPEVIAHEDYGTPADVYSYGIVLYEILTRELPFHGISPMTVALKVSNEGLRPPLPSQTPEPVLQLIRDCWHQKADRRPSFREILQRLEAIKQEMSEKDMRIIKDLAARIHTKPMSTRADSVS